MILRARSACGAHHYVVEYAPAMHAYTTDTTVTITDLYPGDANYFHGAVATRQASYSDSLSKCAY